MRSSSLYEHLEPFDPDLPRCVDAASEQPRWSAEVWAEVSGVRYEACHQPAGSNALELLEDLRPMLLEMARKPPNAFGPLLLQQNPCHSCCGQDPVVKLRVALRPAGPASMLAGAAFDKGSVLGLWGISECHSNNALVRQNWKARARKGIWKDLVLLAGFVVCMYATDYPAQQVECPDNEFSD